MFIPSRIIDQVKMINIHPSLLPKWRGPAPIQFTLLGGESKTGVSIIDLHPEAIDAGNILAVERCKIPEKCYYSDLEAKLAQVGGQMAARVVDNLEKYWNEKQPQDDSLATFTKKITKLDGIVDLKLHSAPEIDRKVRALSQQIPIRTTIEDRTVFLDDMVPLTNRSFAGSIHYDKHERVIFFKTADSSFIGFKSFKIEGKSVIYPAGSFYSNFVRSSAPRSC